MENIIEGKKKTNSFLQWMYTIKLNGNIIFKNAFIRYSKRIGSNFIVVDEVESNLQDLFEEKAKPLFKSDGRILGFYKNILKNSITIFTNKNESFEISKEKNDMLEEVD